MGGKNKLNLWQLGEILLVTLKISPSILLIPRHADMIELTYLTRNNENLSYISFASSYALMPTVLPLKTVTSVFILVQHKVI